MAFKINLTPPFKAEIDSVKGGFKNVAPFKEKNLKNCHQLVDTIKIC